MASLLDNVEGWLRGLAPAAIAGVQVSGPAHLWTPPAGLPITSGRSGRCRRSCSRGEPVLRGSSYHRVQGGAVVSPDAEPRQPTLFATGYGTVSVTPDVAVLRFYVYRTHPTNHMAAYRAAVDAAQQVIAALREEGLADDALRTVDIETNTRHHTDRQGRRHLIEHEVRYVLEARVRDFELAGKLVGRALAAGASEATLWGFEISDVRELELQAVEHAVRHARERAEAAARAAGVRVGPPLRMNLRLSGRASRYDYRDSFVVYSAGPAEEPAAPISPGQREIGAEVEVTFALEPSG